MLLDALRAALRRLLMPLVRFATAGTICEWQLADDDAGRLLIIIIDGFGQTYAMPQPAAAFRSMARTMLEMADETDPQTRSL